MRRARRALDASTRAEFASRAVQQLIERDDVFDGCRTVALYAAAGAEADPTALEPWLKDQGIAIAYPRVHEGQLQFHLALRKNLVTSDDDALGIDGERIPEPAAHAPQISLEVIDVLIVPGLAFSFEGARLGYGGGYYDRALAQRAMAPQIETTSPGVSVPGPSAGPSAGQSARPVSEAPRTIGFCFSLQIVADIPQAPHDIRMDALVSELGFHRCR
ncbi:MAG: hypothetical protein H6729_10450 [Deltaproteobacteria bacterium]|nr:hypothetical protein [Deltaproteobacteria bacterium]